MINKSRGKYSTSLTQVPDKDHFIEENYFFPKREIKEEDFFEVSKETMLINKYHVYPSKIVFKDQKFIIVEAREKQTGRVRLAKIYSKDKYMSVFEKSKLERTVLKNLENSKSFLKLIEILEHGKKVVFIYEYGLPIERLSQDLSISDVKLMCVSILIGVCEVNSFGYSLVNFNSKNVFKSEEGDYKIITLDNLTKIGGTIDERILTQKSNHSICPFVKETLKVNMSADSYSFGIFFYQLLDTIRKDGNFLISRKKNHHRKFHNAEEREILRWTLDKSLRTRLKPYEILSDSFFEEFIRERPEFERRIRTSYKKGKGTKQNISKNCSVTNVMSCGTDEDSEEPSPKSSKKDSQCSTSPTKNRVSNPMIKRSKKRRNKTVLYTRPIYSDFLMGKNKRKMKDASSKELLNTMIDDILSRPKKNESANETQGQNKNSLRKTKDRKFKKAALKSDRILNSSNTARGFWSNLFAVLGCSPQED